MEQPSRNTLDITKSGISPAFSGILLKDQPRERGRRFHIKRGQIMLSLMRYLPIPVLLVNLLPVATAKTAQTQLHPAPVTLEVMNPMGVIEPPATLGISKRVADLAGKKIALMHNNKPGASNLLDALEKLLSKKYPSASFVRGYQTGPVQPPKDPEMYKKAAAECDTFVFAMGD